MHRIRTTTLQRHASDPSDPSDSDTDTLLGVKKANSTSPNAKRTTCISAGSESKHWRHWIQSEFVYHFCVSSDSPWAAIRAELVDWLRHILHHYPLKWGHCYPHEQIDNQQLFSIAATRMPWKTTTYKQRSLVRSSRGHPGPLVLGLPLPTSFHVNVLKNDVIKLTLAICQLLDKLVSSRWSSAGERDWRGSWQGVGG